MYLDVNSPSKLYDTYCVYETSLVIHLVVIVTTYILHSVPVSAVLTCGQNEYIPPIMKMIQCISSLTTYSVEVPLTLKNN